MFTQGFLFGLAIAAPVGPIGLLCLQRSLNYGRFAGFLSGLGAATADALYGSLAAFGLSLVTGFLVAQQQWLRFGGGLFIIYLGLRTLLAARSAGLPTPVQPNLPSTPNLAAMYGSTLLLTLANPVTILSFTAVFAGFGVGSTSSSWREGVMLVLGVFTGSALWWLTLSSLAGALRRRLEHGALRLINIGSGMLLIVFGAVLFWQMASS